MIKINKQKVKQALKEHGFTMIPKSWYDGDTDEERHNAVFNAYDKYGTCYHFYVDAEIKHALSWVLSYLNTNEHRDVTYMFADYFFGD